MWASASAKNVCQLSSYGGDTLTLTLILFLTSNRQTNDSASVRFIMKQAQKFAFDLAQKNKNKRSTR